VTIYVVGLLPAFFPAAPKAVFLHPGGSRKTDRQVNIY
jgi:hypothetical protein